MMHATRYGTAETVLAEASEDMWVKMMSKSLYMYPNGRSSTAVRSSCSWLEMSWIEIDDSPDSECPPPPKLSSLARGTSGEPGGGGGGDGIGSGSGGVNSIMVIKTAVPNPTQNATLG